MRILIIEDDKDLLDNIIEFFKKEKMVCEWATDGEDGEFRALEETFDAIILDINLPIKNGFDVLKSIRNKKIATPILMLTARDNVPDKIKGLDLGADDYLAKPFSLAELSARVRALIRRSSRNPLPKIIIDDLEIDTLKHSICRGGEKIKLASKEYAVLEFLARRKGEVVTRNMILDHIWGSDFETMSNVVDVYIRNLRRKIDKPGKRQLIHTIRGAGYILEVNSK